jgi:hypothetical protein
MKPEEFTLALSRIFPEEGYDSEIAHGQADDLMTDTLESLGYDCSLFSEADIWYA